jgi:hypothetical protein
MGGSGGEEGQESEPTLYRRKALFIVGGEEE